MNYFNEILNIAKKELGVEEFPGPAANPRIIKYFSTVLFKAQSDEIPWCSAFVNWVVTEAGLKGTNSAAALSWRSWGRRLIVPVPGCICVLKRGSNPLYGHVGIFSHANSKIYLYGGNQHNKVSLEGFDKERLICYRSPLVSP